MSLSNNEGTRSLITWVQSNYVHNFDAIAPRKGCSEVLTSFVIGGEEVQLGPRQLLGAEQSRGELASWELSNLPGEVEAVTVEGQRGRPSQVGLRANERVGGQKG